MNADQDSSLTQEAAPAADDRLDSWKEIAAYLRRDITTVRRWEKREGLPVHRHLHERRESVYAFRSEIDSWWRGRRAELNNGDAGNGTGPVPLTAAPFSRREVVGWGLAGLCLIAVGALGWRLMSPAETGESSKGPRLQFTIAPPDGTTITALSLSPDGQQLAFTTLPRSGPGQTSLLWVQRLDDRRARAIPDTEGGQLPFWSPHADALGFFSEGKLWVVTLAGGAPRVIAAAPEPRGGTWSADDVIVFAPNRDGSLYRVPAAGGEPVAVTTVEQPTESGHLWPSFLPDGRRFLYLADSNVPASHGIFVGSIDGSGRTRVIEGGASNAAYSGAGMLVFSRDRLLVAQPFDPQRLALTGDPVVVADEVQAPLGGDHRHDFAVASSDIVVYRSRQSAAVRLVWRDRQGGSTRLTTEPAQYTEPTLSPDESRIAVGLFFPEPSRRFGFGTAEIRSDITMFAIESGAAVPFVEDPGAEWGVVWSPDGRQVVYSSNVRDRTLELYKRSTTGGNNAERVLAVVAGNPVAQSWSPDGRFLLYSQFDPKTHMDLWLLPMTGDGKPEPLLHSEFSERQGQISRDGRWLAYSSTETGRLEVYVQPFRAPGPRHQISTDGGGDPRWSHDGRELFYIAGDRRLMSVPVVSGRTFQARAPVALFDTGMPPQWYEARNLYDVSRDGRFLFMEPVEDDRSLPLTVLVNRLAR